MAAYAITVQSFHYSNQGHGYTHTDNPAIPDCTTDTSEVPTGLPTLSYDGSTYRQPLDLEVGDFTGSAAHRDYQASMSNLDLDTSYAFITSMPECGGGPSASYPKGEEVGAVFCAPSARTPLMSDHLVGSCTASRSQPAGVSGGSDVTGWTLSWHLAVTRTPVHSRCSRHGPTAPSVAYGTRAESRLTAGLPAHPNGSPLSKWTLVQSFGTENWHFKWEGNGSFSMVPPTTGKASFTYKVKAENGCRSALGMATVSRASATFASAGTASEATPVYVGMGDSYSSGEGNPSFMPGTATDLDKLAGVTDKCHRSTKAYSYQEWKDNLQPKVPALHFLFTACSGAVISNLTSTVQYPDGLAIDRQPQVAQVDKYELDPHQYVRFISLTVGGNNAYFSKIVQ